MEGLLLGRFNASDACSGARLVRTVQRSGFRVRSSAGEAVEDLTSRTDADLASIKFDDQDMFGERESA